MLRHQCCRHADHTIQHNGYMPQRAADAHTGKSCNVQSSDCLQYREGISMPQVIGFQCGADNLLLTSQSLVRKSRTSAGDFLCFALQKSCRHRTAGSRVADSHFPSGQKSVTLLLAILYQFDSCDNGPDSLFLRHRRFFQKISCAGTHLTIQDAGNGFLTIYSDIHRDRLRANALRHLADGGSFPCHGLCHRQRDLLPRLAHAFLHDSVVCTEDQHTFFPKVDLFRSQYSSDLRRNGFKAAHAVQRFCQGIPVFFHKTSHRFLRCRDPDLRQFLSGIVMKYGLL